MAERSASERIVVTGMGLISPLGLNVESSWKQLIKGEHGIRPWVPEDEDMRLLAEKIDVHLAAPVVGFNLMDVEPQKGVKPLDIQAVRKDLKQWHSTAQLGVAAAVEAVHQAGLSTGLKIDRSLVDPGEFGVSIGTGLGGANELANVRDILRQKDGSRVRTTSLLNALPGRPAEVVARWLRPGDETEPISFMEAQFEECATGNANIANAADQIRLGRATVALAGSVESALEEPDPIAGFNAIKALTHSNDPDTASRPFDRDRDGLVFGAGAGVLVLETLEHAQRRGATVLAELIGYGKSGDAYDDTGSSGYGGVVAIEKALKDAGVQPEEVDYINAHGTSTPEGDVSEMRVLSKGFKSDRPRPYVSSTKGATGHTLGAASSIESIFTIKAVQEGVIPPSRNLDNPIEEATGWRMSPHEATEPAGGVNVGMNNSFGFGGSNYITVWARG